MNKNRKIQSLSNKNLPVKQVGATLFTSLVFLILMTIVGVSATKLSILDILMSGNNLQKVEIYQQTDRDLKNATTVVKLYEPLVDTTKGPLNTWTYTLPADTSYPNTEREIANNVQKYQCGGFDGEAVSIGPDVPPCYLYEFKATSKKQYSSAKDRHNRGAGKEFPNPTKNSYLEH